MVQSGELWVKKHLLWITIWESSRKGQFPQRRSQSCGQAETSEGRDLPEQFCRMDIYSSGRTNTGSYSLLQTLFLCLILFNWLKRIQLYRVREKFGMWIHFMIFHVFICGDVQGPWRFEVMDRMFQEVLRNDRQDHFNHYLFIQCSESDSVTLLFWCY